MRITTSLATYALASVLAYGCYSSSDQLSGGDGVDAPDAPVDTVYDVPYPDLPSDPPGPDVVTDSPWPDTPEDVPADTPWPDVPWDVPPDPADPDVMPGGIVGDGCSSWYDCTGMPTPGAECWTDIMGFLSFPGGYCSANCSSSWECGTLGECVDLSFISLCLRTCDYVEDCRETEGYDCMDMPFVGGGPFCLPTG